MKSRLWASLVFSLVMTVVGGVALVSPAAASLPTNASGPWKIWPLISGSCLEVQGQSTANSAKVQQYSCGTPTPSHRQWWFSQQGSSTTQHIINSKSEKCMNLQGGSSVNGTAIIQYDCSTSTNNGWYERPGPTIGGHDYYQLVSIRTGKCMNVRGATQDLGADIIEWECGDGPSESFLFSWSRV